MNIMMKVRIAYILYLIEELEDEVKEVVYAVFSDIEQAEEQGKGLVELSDNDYINYHVSECTFFD